MEKNIWHGVMAMVLAVCIAAVVQPGQSQMAPESQLHIPRDGIIAAETLASEKFAIKLPPKKGKSSFKRGFDIGWQIAQCLGNYDNVKVCGAQFRQVFTIGDFEGLTADCCDAFTGIADDCLAMSIAGYLPQIRVPATTITAYCSIVKTLQSFIK